MSADNNNENLGKIYATRATEGSKPLVSSISIPKIREARDQVYNGTMNTPIIDGATNSGFQGSRNKKTSRKRISPFNIVLILLCIAIVSVLYISNILAVGRLLNQINQFQIKHQQIQNEQEMLKAQINRSSSLERIQQFARDQLGLQNPKQLPIWIEIDPEQITQVEELIQQRKQQSQ